MPPSLVSFKQMMTAKLDVNSLERKEMREKYMKNTENGPSPREVLSVEYTQNVALRGHCLALGKG